MTYYSNVNPDLLSRVPVDAKRVLEVGCGTGNFAQAYLSKNPDCEYWGVEFFETAALEAEKKLHRVFHGDIETADLLHKLDQARGQDRFDALIFGDVLEHLNDPWSLLAGLRERMSNGATLCVCVPNVSHWSVVVGQLRGQWTYRDSGLLDRTHLRFFTRASAVEMIRGAGWTFVDAHPRVFQQAATQDAIDKLAPSLDAMGIDRVGAVEDLSAFQWILRAVNGPSARTITVAGLGLKKVAGVTEARIDHPMRALATLPRIRATWGAESLSLPRSWPPGVLTVHRRFLNNDALASTVDGLIAKGWIVVSDIDDDPHHWPQYVQSDFAAFRRVHAVSVSTEPLAEMVSQWNRNVKVLPNAIDTLPSISPSTPKNPDGLRLFFGALNRSRDWDLVLAPFKAWLAECGAAVSVQVVHDRAFFNAIGPDVRKVFHDTLPFEQYMSVLATCDIALLPLEDTAFNRLKSDLKLVECCAAGVVPICSSVVYREDARHESIAVFADTPADWPVALQGLVGDPDRILRMRENGLRYVARERMHATQVNEREAWYRSLLLDRDRLEADRQQRL